MITVRRFSTIAAICLFTTLLTACIQPISVTPSPAANDPVTVFNALHAAINADDIDAALAMFAEDAVVQFPNDPTLGVFKGRTEIHKWLAMGAAKNIQVATADLRVSGDTLFYTASVDVDDLRPLGITLVGPAEITVQDGKITALTHVFSDETLAKLQAAPQ